MGSRKTYVEFYREFVRKKTAKSLETDFKRSGLWERYGIKKLEIRKDEFPFILVTVLMDDWFGGATSSFFLEGHLIKGYDRPYFLLPTVFTNSFNEPIVKKYFSREQTLVHELIHIHDLLEWIGEEPEYIDRAMSLGFENVREEKIEESVDFETQKLFRLEPPALRADFKAGWDMIYEQVLGRMLLKYRCENEDEFLLWQMRRYVFDLKSRYENHFPSLGKEIEAAFALSVDRHGRTLFDHPWQALNLNNEEFVDKMLDFSVAEL